MKRSRKHHKHAAYMLRSLVCITAYSLLFCSAYADSFHEYTNGGDYSTRAPALTSDGKLLLFSSPKTGRGDIYKMILSSKELLRLTSSDNFESSPIWLQAIRKIAYEREEGDGNRHIWFMNLDGTEQNQVTFGKGSDELLGAAREGQYIVLCRSHLTGGLGKTSSVFLVPTKRDGQWVGPFTGNVFVLEKEKGLVTTILNQEGGMGVYSVVQCKIDGQVVKNVCEGSAIDCSDDGRTMLVQKRWGDPVFLVKHNGQQLLIGRDVHTPIITPDGKHVLFTTNWGQKLRRVSINDGIDAAIEMPVDGAIKEVRRCGTGVVLLIKEHSGINRAGTVFLIDCDSWKVNKLQSIGEED